MSLQQGSFSITRYRVLGRKKRLSLSELNQNIHGFKAPPITLQKAARELSSGWVLPENPELDRGADDGQDWDLSDCLFEEGLLLRLRIDRKTVSAQLQQALMKQRWRETRVHESGPEPARVQKKQIQEEVKEELLELSLPSISYVEAFWKDQEDVVYLFSQSKMARECFEELFRHTFGQPLGLTLFRVLPPLLGLSPEAWQSLPAQERLLESLTHTLPGRGDVVVS